MSDMKRTLLPTATDMAVSKSIKEQSDIYEPIIARLRKLLEAAEELNDDGEFMGRRFRPQIKMARNFLWRYL